MNKESFIAIFILLVPVLVIYGFLLNNKSGDNSRPRNLGTHEVASPISKSTSKDNVLRKSAVAGQFYPSEKGILDRQIKSYLSKAEKIPSNEKLRILFVPHAGLDYSGEVAAWGYKQIEGENYNRIILIGSSHEIPINHVAVYPSGEWETPLGRVSVDEDFSSKLINTEENIIRDVDTFRNDHTLEMQVIFLQKVLNEFVIVPVLVGNMNPDLTEILAQKISVNMDDSTLLIISTDLAHYPSWEDANEADKRTISAIITGKKDEFERNVKEDSIKPYENLETYACGYEAIKVGLRVSELLDVTDFKKLKYQNSGDVTGEKDRVVGYVAIGAWSSELPVFTISEESKTVMVELARNAINAYLNGRSNLRYVPHNTFLYKPLGAFVTLKNDGILRGCIGHFQSAEPLYKVIQSAAIAAASKDSRFEPVKLEEMSDINIEISVMTPKVPIKSWNDIVLGKHGVVIQKGKNSGTFLPQVAIDTGWSKEDFLGELCSQKAGLPRNCYKDPSVSMYVFEVEIIDEN